MTVRAYAQELDGGDGMGTVTVACLPRQVQGNWSFEGLMAFVLHHALLEGNGG